MNKRLYKGLKAYAKWAYEDGAPKHNSHGFSDLFGLCSNMTDFGVYGAYDTLSQMFAAEGLNTLNPFATNEGEDWVDKHKNPVRKAWVLKKIAEYEKEYGHHSDINNDELLDFLHLYACWAYERGAPDGLPFYRMYGLCSNADIRFGMRTKEDLISMLVKEFGYNAHPFGRDKYYYHIRNKTQHLDQDRKDWVIAAIKRLENEGSEK